MKKYFARFIGLNLLPKATTMFFPDETEVEAPVAEKTYTEKEVAAKANASFKAGQKAAEQNKELEELRAFKATQEAIQKEKALVDALSDEKVKELGLKGQEIFIKQYGSRIEGKKGDELIAELNKIKVEKGNEIFFDSAEVNASDALKQAAQPTGTTTKKVEFYPGTTIRK